MPLVTPFSSASATGTVVNLGTADDLYLGPLIFLASGATAVIGTGSNQEVTVDGRIFGTNGAVALGNDAAADTQNVVSVSDSGALLTSSNAALTFIGSGGLIKNRGLIEGIVADSGGSFVLTVRNSGTIDGNGSALRLLGTGEVQLYNSGTMRSQGFVYEGAGFEATDRITNTGLMVGDVAMAQGTNILTNEGTIRGDVRGLFNNDQVTNLGTITGMVNLGAGNNAVNNAGTLRADYVGGVGGDNFINEGRVFGAIFLDDGNNIYDGRRAVSTGLTLEIFAGAGFTSSSQAPPARRSTAVPARPG
jgi:hypothetical protein